MNAPPIEDVQKALERVIRPIVEGQIRGFCKEHPSVVEAVNWYRRRADKAQTFTNSLSKRIVRDLTCGLTAARLEAALLEFGSDESPESSVEDCTAAIPTRLANLLSEWEPCRVWYAAIRAADVARAA